MWHRARSLKPYTYSATDMATRTLKGAAAVAYVKERAMLHRIQTAKVHMRIHLKDGGQDFLWWDIDKGGMVVDCGPFQATVWQGSEVLMPELLKKGSKIHLVTKTGSPMLLKYPVKSIDKNPVPRGTSTDKPQTTTAR